VIATVRTMMARAIDYAGLFPPARLSMDAAVAEYRRIQGERESWMVGRFVCPASRLTELAELWPERTGPPLAVIALGGGAASTAEMVERTREDAAAIRAFTARPGRRAVVDQLELRLPPELVAGRDADAVLRAVAVLHETHHRGAAAPLLIAVETPVAASPPEDAVAVADGIARWNRTAVAAGHLPVCLKVRCGGLEPAAIPSVDDLSGALAVCRDRDVPIKATQGLHHPLPRFDHAIGATAHGFLNLMAAAILARAHRLDRAEIAAILGEREPSRFVFAEDSFVWGDRRATLADVAAGRRYALLSFGSCSFADPRDDLAALGLIGEQ
jgi:hypothetical protein